MKGQHVSLGRIHATRGSLDSLSQEDINTALVRHSSGDWGEVCEEDRQANEQAIAEELRLFSVYRSSTGVKFWVITEHDRSLTTILLPEEY